jgi:hypothetical protein
MSLGGAGASAVIDDAVDYAIAHEVVLVAAAGNDASPVLQYPAAAPGVYGVTATDGAGKFAWFSNHGPWYYLAAPGIGIRSTAMSAGATAAYATGSGTSFSAPIVAGVMALVRERHPGWGWFEVGDEVVRTARDSGPAGLDDAYGFGLLDASAALGVSPIAGVSQPVRTGDAGDTQATARAITVGTNATESINYEYDEDWFAFTVPAAGASAIITVTPPALSNTDRALEMDPAIELYGPGGGRVGASDETFAGEPEQLQLNVGPGRHTVRVTNWAASASPSPYTVRVTLGAGLPPTAWATPLGEFGVENAIQAVASADFSGDGRDDVAVSTRSSNHPDDDFKIFVLTQAADGTLGAPQRLASHAGGSTAGENPLRATDMDGDGDVDLVLGTVTGLDVALNDGDGLTTPVLHPTDDAVRGIQTANLDGTGGTELIVEGQDPNGNASLSVVRWAAGDLATELLGFDAVGTRAGIAYDVADLTGDGRPDIATFAGGDVSLYAQQANGTWAAPTTIAMSGIAGTTFERALATADVSNDGRADLVTLINWRLEPDNGQFQTRVVYRLQLAGGAYGPPVVLPARSDTGAMKVGDVTGDGRNDVVVLHNNANNDAGLFRQNPTGGLAQEELLSEFGAEGQQSPDALAIGDVDDDGINDVMSGSPGLGLYIMRHQGAATTEGPGPWMAGGTPAEHATGVSRTVRPVVRFGRSIDVASVEANETVWLVDGRNGRNFDFSITRTNRDMTLWPIEPLTPGAPYQVWIFGVTSGGGAEGAYERIPFTVAAGAAPSYKVDKTFLPAQVDLDGNGYDDIFWYGTGSAPDSVWFFGPDAVEGVTTSVTGTYTPVPGDFDGNGYDDILWYGPGSATDALWKNGRNGIVSVAMPVGGVYSPIAGDFDGNGYDDIFWYAPGAAADSVWYFGPNGRTSVAQKVTGTAYRPVAGDFNRDGFDDIVWYAPGAAAESLWRGSRNGFAGAVTMSISGTYRGRTLDFNGDGFDEVYLYQPNRGVFWRSGTGGFTSVQDGPPIVSTGRPVTGDFTGDGRGDLLTYVPGTGADRFYRGNATGVG